MMNPFPLMKNLYPLKKHTIIISLCTLLGGIIFIFLPKPLEITRANKKDVQTIKRKIVEDILPTSKQKNVKDLLAKKAKTYLKTLNKDGSWKDINYTTQSKVSWPAARHMDRLLIMAKAYKTNGTDLFSKDSLKKSILKALDAWYRITPINKLNYWWNAIEYLRQL